MSSGARRPEILKQKRRLASSPLGRRSIALTLAAALAVLLWRGYSNATSDPLVRRADIRLAAADASVDVTILLLSDLHVKEPDMPPARLARIISGLNRLHPDVVLIAGDFVGSIPFTGGYSADAIAAPLAGLKAPSGVFAVLGNHDRDRGEALVRALGRAGVTLLQDQAVRAGPVSIGGFDRRWSRMMKSLGRLPAPWIIVAHSPSSVRRLKQSVSLVLAGHTHCGQIVLPLAGAPWIDDDVPPWATCGLTATSQGVVIVSAGVGTSHVPLRFNAPADVWLIHLHGGKPTRARHRHPR